MSDKHYTLQGYEDLEISTQIIIRDAIKRGVEVEILDRKSNFLKLVKNNRTEYVKQATKTSLDSYISFLIMEHKPVTKTILAEEGLSVPGGQVFFEPGKAFLFCREKQDEKIVIKPATTNFGIGITILSQKRKEGAEKQAIAHAFSFDDSILIEEFIEGPEYRFLVIGPETVAVCQRVPANVVGDGQRDIGALVDEKNMDPGRGEGHITPLEKIQKGETEKDVLKERGYTMQSVPGDGETVYLRKNSNISTGGDSLDVTDDADQYFKTVAVKGAAAAGARICGADIIIPDITKKGIYSIIELNFNPVLYIHNYPYRGKNRDVGGKILDLFGF